MCLNWLSNLLFGIGVRKRVQERNERAASISVLLVSATRSYHDFVFGHLDNLLWRNSLILYFFVRFYDYLQRLKSFRKLIFILHKHLYELLQPRIMLLDCLKLVYEHLLILLNLVELISLLKPLVHVVPNLPDNSILTSPTTQIIFKMILLMFPSIFN